MNVTNRTSVAPTYFKKENAYGLRPSGMIYDTSKGKPAFRFWIHDAQQMARILTFRKLLNYGILKISYLLSHILKYPIVWGKPANLAIEPTSVCNLACPECPSGNGTLLRRRGNISWQLFEKSIKELKRWLFTTTLYFQGEPLLNPQLYNMLKHLKKEKIYSIISTNAQFLSPVNCEKLVQSGLNRVIVSLDGIDQDSYAQYRVGGSYHKAVEGIQNLVKEKKRRHSKYPLIILQFLVFKHNQHQLDNVKTLGARLGVDKISIKTAQIYDLKRNTALIPSIPKYSRYTKTIEGKYQLKGKLKNRCWRSWQNPVITVDGELLPCCFDKDADFSYGNVKENSIDAVWNGTTSQQFKATVLKNRKLHKICRNCTEGIKYVH